MGYIINKNGNKEKVEMSPAYTHDNNSPILINDNVVLITKYSLCICIDKDYQNDYEFVEEVILENYPTDYQILYYLIKNGGTPNNSYANITKIKVWDYDE